MTTGKLKASFWMLFMTNLFVLTVSAQPRRFGEGAIPIDKAFGLAISPDGRNVYFVNSRGGRDTMTIEAVTVRGDKLSSPALIEFSNKPGIWKDIDPFISPDGKKMLFNSNRPKPGEPDKHDFDIWAVDLGSDGQPGEPYHLGSEVNSDSADFFATISANGNLYFSSLRETAKGDVDLYVSEWQAGQYLRPRRLPAPLNSSKPDSNPFIAPDESFLIFVRDGADGYGDSDLYISFKVADGWSDPINLGPEVNTRHAEFCPYFDVRTQTLYFGRIVRGKPLRENIYFMKFNPETLKTRKP